MASFCGDCDGCGWVEGGVTLKTECSTCKGSGMAPKTKGTTTRRLPAAMRTIRTPTLQVEKAINLQFYVVLRGANGEKVAWTETYTRRSDADRARRTWEELMATLGG